MNLRRALICVALLFIGLPLQAGAQEQNQSKRELIVLVLIDATRADHVGCYGYKKPTTPFIDKLCAKGQRYERMYVNAPWTRPSTASYLTGINATKHTTETEKSKLPEDVRTLAARLKEKGWTTGGFTANGNGGSLANLDKDFDEFRDTTNTYKPSVRGKTYNRLPTGPFIAGKALEWLAKQDDDKIFLFVFFVDPHDPYGAPPRLEKIFLDPNYKGKVRRHALWEANNDYPEGERKSMQAIYDAGIRHADEATQQLWRGIEKLGLADNTSMFVTADHGEGFGEHGFYLHAHHFWEEVIHVPLIAVGPRFEPGVDSRLTQAIDVTATIADLAGADMSGLAGHSLLKPPRANPYVISEYNEFGIHRQAIVGERYKVIWQRPADWSWYSKTAIRKEYFPSVSFDKEVIHVYDLNNDPGETKDLSQNMPEEAQKLLEKLRAFVPDPPPKMVQ